MNRDDRLARLEQALGRWMQPDRFEMVIRELRATGAPVHGGDGVFVWICPREQCAKEQMNAFSRKLDELEARGFRNDLERLGPFLTICMGRDCGRRRAENEDAVTSGSQLPDASAGISPETPSTVGLSPGEAG